MGSTLGMVLLTLPSDYSESANENDGTIGKGFCGRVPPHLLQESMAGLYTNGLSVIIIRRRWGTITFIRKGKE